jgi:hypothetical protein
MTQVCVGKMSPIFVRLVEFSFFVMDVHKECIFNGIDGGAKQSLYLQTLSWK